MSVPKSFWQRQSHCHNQSFPMTSNITSDNIRTILNSNLTECSIGRCLSYVLKSPDSNNVVFQKAGVTPNILGNFKSGGNHGTVFLGSIFYTQTVYPQIFGETQKVGVYPVFIFHILSHIKNKNSAVNRHII